MSRVSVLHNYEYISTYADAMQQINPNRFVLTIRQQPIQTRLSSSNERDRRPLDPPPIVQIELDNSTTQETQDFLQNPYLFMSVSLVHSSMREEIANIAHNILSGQTSSSMYKLKDINNHDGGFFVFGDITVKLEGQYRLKFSMFEISKYGVTNLKSIYSNTFQVYASKLFPGMLDSTFLSRSFSDQGVRIRIRKEHRVHMTGSRKRKLSSSQDEGSESEERLIYTDRSSQNHHIIQEQQHHRHYVQQQSISQSPNSHYSYQAQLTHPYRTQQSHWSPNMDSINSSDDRHGSFNSAATANSDMTLNSHRMNHIDRRPSIPYSPPHPSYDSSKMAIGNNSGSYYVNSYAKNHNYQHSQLHPFKTDHHTMNIRHRHSMIPSPPPQSSLFKPELRRLSTDDAFATAGPNNTVRRLSADPHYYQADHHRRGSRRIPLQQQRSQIFHPPPLVQPAKHNFGNDKQSAGNDEIIHLPPLRSIALNGDNNNSNNRLLRLDRHHNVSSTLLTLKHHYHPQQDDAGEVDAAVAMMQLASRRQAGTKVNY